MRRPTRPEGSAPRCYARSSLSEEEGRAAIVALWTDTEQSEVFCSSFELAKGRIESDS